METKKIEKKVYSTPKLVVYGSVDVITQGNASGAFLDQDFPAGTLFKDLEFSE